MKRMDILYQTDELGRIERASGELTLEMGERNSKHQLAAGGEDRVKAPSTSKAIKWWTFNRYAI